MQLLQPDEENCRSEILHAGVYGIDLSKGTARAGIFLCDLNVSDSMVVEHWWFTLVICWAEPAIIPCMHEKCTELMIWGLLFYYFLLDHIIGVINNQAVKWHIETTLKNLVLNNLHKHNKHMHSNVSVNASAKCHV